MLRIIWYLPVEVPRSRRVVFSLTFFFFALLDSADVESLSEDSSDEENDERKEEDEQSSELTSMDEALRTVTDRADVSQEDFIKQNFETLEESSSSSSMGRRGQTLTCYFTKNSSTFWGKRLCSFLLS